MTLNPAIQMLLTMMADAPATDFSTAEVAETREALDNRTLPGTPPEVGEVRELSVTLEGRTLAARLYIPLGHGSGGPPLVMYFHGGGWVVGTLDTHDAPCRALANASGAAVLSLGYRLAPEHPYPAPVDDCYDATLWAAAHAGDLGVDGTRLAVAGDSAGGNLAAAVALMIRDRGGPDLAHQLLIYPVTDTDLSRPSYLANGGGDYFLSTEAMRWFWNHYLGDTADADAPLAKIIDNALAGLPPATVITAQFDPLCDEGEAYAQKLSAAGVPTDYHCAPGMIHGFFNMFQIVPDAVPWIEKAGANLAKDFVV
jgi:acetyl esterase